MKITVLHLIAAIAMVHIAGSPIGSRCSRRIRRLFDTDGTAHITRVVPMPTTISPEAQQWLQSLAQQKGRAAGNAGGAPRPNR